jgi:hypothetical protein
MEEAMWTCSNCGETGEEGMDYCWKCGTGKDGSPPENPEAFADNRQNALELAVDPGDGTQAVGRPRSGYNIIPDIFFILAGILALVTVVTAIGVAVTTAEGTGGVSGVLAGLLALFSGAVSVLLTVTIGVVVRTLLDIEWNTRRNE